MKSKKDTKMMTSKSSTTKKKKKKSAAEKLISSKLNAGKVRRLIIAKHTFKENIIDSCFYHTIFPTDIILFDFKKQFIYKNCRKFRYAYKLCRNRGLKVGIHIKDGESFNKKFLEKHFDYFVVDSDNTSEWLKSFISKKEDFFFKEKDVKKSTTLVL